MSYLKSDTETEGEPLKLLEISGGPSQCKICFHPANPDGLKVGPLYKLDECQAHMFCLNFSSALEQKGEDEEGIKGFLCEDIVKEWRRGSRLKCVYCGNKYATTGCCSKKCKKSFHFPCGLKSGGMFQFFGEFNSFCKEHRPVQSPTVFRSKAAEEENTCGVCLDDVEERVSSNVLWTPCCGGWFHRSCIETMAENAGLAFFKCPLCCNKEKFEKEMQEFGIYIPDRDAEWEKDNAYEALYQRHNRCDVVVCVCQEGRFRDDVNMESPWEIFLCRICGHQGAHIECGKLNFDFPLFKCESCLEIVKKLPSKPHPVFEKIAKNEIQIVKASDDPSVDPVERMSSKLMKNAIFKVKGNTLDVTRKTSNVVFNITPIPAFDISLPVRVGGIKNVNVKNASAMPTQENASEKSFECTIEELLDSHSEDEQSPLSTTSLNKSPPLSASGLKQNSIKTLNPGTKRKLENAYLQELTGSNKRKKEMPKSSQINGNSLKGKQVLQVNGKLNSPTKKKTLQLNGKFSKGKNTLYLNSHRGKKTLQNENLLKATKTLQVNENLPEEEKRIEVIQLSSDSEHSDEDDVAEEAVNPSTSSEESKRNPEMIENTYSLSMVERTRSNKPKMSFEKRRKLSPIERDGFSLKNSNPDVGSPSPNRLNERYSLCDFTLLRKKSTYSFQNQLRILSPRSINQKMSYNRSPDGDEWLSSDEQIPTENSNISMEKSTKSPRNPQFLLISSVEEEKSRSPSPVEESTESFTFGAFCLRCGISFPNPSALEMHTALHSLSSPRKFFCDKFGKLQKLAIKTEIAGITKLKNKENENLPEDKKKRLSVRGRPAVGYGELFYCDYQCGFSTKVLGTMTNHVKGHHSSNNNAGYPCHQCTWILISPKQLRKHQRMHQMKHQRMHQMKYEVKGKLETVGSASNETNVINMSCHECDDVTLSVPDLAKCC